MQTKKPKKKNVKVQPVESVSEKTIDDVANEMEKMSIMEESNNQQQEENDDSTVKTSDFIEPLTITDELEEEDLSDIEDE